MLSPLQFGPKAERGALPHSH